MDVDFNEENVRLVSRAIGAYVNEVEDPSRGIIVGYDTRLNSRRFAWIAAEEISRLGIPVLVVQEPTPTPVVAYHVSRLKTSGAIMITASHNPPEYNGIKFIPKYAGPATTDITKWIESRIRGEQKPPLETAGKGSIGLFDPKPEYFRHLKKLVNLKKISGLRIVYDPMYGCGLGYVDELLREAGASVTTIHGERDPSFKGLTPEPILPHLGDLVIEVRKQNADLGLANDGDADRFGIVEFEPGFMHPNTVLPTIAWYLLEKRRLKGSIVRSIATTHLIDRIAWDYGVVVCETPVGFKRIAEFMVSGNVILGCEESGGLSIMGHIPDKDGILACLLLAEIRGETCKRINDIVEELWREYGRRYYERMDIKMRVEQRDKVINELK